MGYDPARILKPRAMAVLVPSAVLISQCHMPQGAAHEEGFDDICSEAVTSTRAAAAPCVSLAEAELTPRIAAQLHVQPSAAAGGCSDCKPSCLVAISHGRGITPLSALAGSPDTAASVAMCKSEDPLQLMRETAEEQAPLYAAARALLAQPPRTPMTGLSTSTCVIWHALPPSPTTSLCNIQDSSRRDSMGFGSSISSQVSILHFSKSVCGTDWNRWYAVPIGTVRRH